MIKKEKIVLTKGKKKTATARVRIKKGIGSIKINGIPLEIFQPTAAKEIIEEPILLAENVLGKNFALDLDIDANIKGGGVIGQAYACRTALGKGLLEWSENKELKKTYLDYDRSLITDDVRVKESKKYLRKGARAKPIKSYR